MNVIVIHKLHILEQIFFYIPLLPLFGSQLEKLAFYCMFRESFLNMQLNPNIPSWDPKSGKSGLEILS